MFLPSKVIIFGLLVLCISVLGIPSLETVQYPVLSENIATSIGIVDTESVTGRVAKNILPLLDSLDRNDILLDVITGKCAYYAGCKKGYCWTPCKAVGIFFEWCYSTKGSSQDYQYVKCSSDSECNKCWKCAGPCSV